MENVQFMETQLPRRDASQQVLGTMSDNRRVQLMLIAICARLEVLPYLIISTTKSDYRFS